MATQGNILVVGGDAPLRAACVQALERAGYRTRTADTGDAALQACQRESFDAAALELMAAGVPGMEVLRRLKETDCALPVVVVTAHGTIGTAVAAMKLGAADYLAMPFAHETLVSTVRAAAEARRSALRDAHALSALDESVMGDMIVGRSEGMARVALLIRKVAPTDSTVLVTGETGCGKELVARTVHRLSTRHAGPFVTVDCGTLVETLLESELFGHVKGSFTGATDTTDGKFLMADRGTLFLDEIANISVDMQARLLRAIQERETARVGSTQWVKVDVRVIAATNRDLPGEIRKGRFREDLYYRLNVFHIPVPPLRERIEDIPLLAQYFLRRVRRPEGAMPLRIGDDAMRALKVHDWPGNVRELRNAIERAVVVCDAAVIEARDLALGVASARADSAPGPQGALADVERQQIAFALKRFSGHRSQAAEYLGINRKTLREKIRRYAIQCRGSEAGEAGR